MVSPPLRLSRLAGRVLEGGLPWLLQPGVKLELVHVHAALTGSSASARMKRFLSTASSKFISQVISSQSYPQLLITLVQVFSLLTMLLFRMIENLEKLERRHQDFPTLARAVVLDIVFMSWVILQPYTITAFTLVTMAVSRLWVYVVLSFRRR